ncbi:hypothetical protein TRFO_38054 [Tritrichomonas foetus]|uniref:Uncharacterized protein n=1 Tax=Tritrichomonas foetus TaxID=1144522 RepID=A0A1J4JC28_9EUKA|nr:hypothetical protein TRFO_38054 [Tritrichomonas foetus]|eukprot:OHS95807.1 hypothetical protein TRFO_38054 [Tritrichomonas foetus]
MEGGKVIAVHNQSFHADDALSIYFLRQTDEFKGASYIRSRDPEELNRADVVCDVGGIYDHEKRRYDHHQPTFKMTFPNSTVQLASCGLVYFHFGHEINKNILKENGRDLGNHSDLVYEAMYRLFVKEIDANDNGVSLYPNEAEVKYNLNTCVSQRIGMLNNIGTFDDAIELIGNEYKNRLLRFFDSDVPAIEVAEHTFKSRFDVDESGQILVNEEKCSIDHRIKELEKETNCKEILYNIFPRDDGSWNIRALNSSGFELRKPLPFRGLRDEELSKACGIPGGVFVHKNGFIGAFKTKEAAIQFAKLAVNYTE